MTRLSGKPWWRVLALTAATAIAMSLVPSGAEAAIGQPAGLSPNDDSGALVKNLELGWSAVAGATSYDVQVAQEETFEGDVLSVSAATPHFAVPVSLPRGGYVWRVRANTADGAGPWSSVATFTRGWDRGLAPGSPRLVTSAGASPTGGHVDVPAGETPAFTWQPLSDASFYEVEVSSQPFTSSSPVYSGTADEYRVTCYTQRPWFVPYGVVAGASDSPGDQAKCTMGMTAEPAPADGKMDGKLHDGATYYWRVRGRDGTQNAGTTPFADPSLSCTGVWNTTGATAGSGGMVSVVIPSKAPSYLGTPECSQWAEGGTFSITSTGASAVSSPPATLAVQPTGGDPTASRVAVTGTPLFSWSKVSGAYFYRVFLSRTRDITDSDFVYETQATSFTPVGSYADRSVPMYWTVQACGAEACSPAAPVRSFTKAGRNLVSVLGSSVTGNETTLRWTTQFSTDRPGTSPIPFDDQAASYQVQVSADGDWSKPALDVVVDRLGNDPASTYLRLATASLPDRYVWRVRARDQVGRAWGWAYSAPYGRIVTPSGFGLKSPLTIQFTEPVTGVANGAAIKDAGGRMVAGRFAQKSATEWTFTPANGWVAGQSYKLALDGVTDRSGRAVRLVPGTVRAAVVVDSDSGLLRTTKGDRAWKRVTASDAQGKSFLRSSDRPGTKAKSKATALVKGRQVTVWACKTPRSGDATLRLDGKKVDVLRLYRGYSGCGVVYKSKTLKNTVHTVTLVAKGTKHKKSKGYDISVDAIGTR